MAACEHSYRFFATRTTVHKERTVVQEEIYECVKCGFTKENVLYASEDAVLILRRGDIKTSMSYPFKEKPNGGDEEKRCV